MGRNIRPGPSRPKAWWLSISIFMIALLTFGTIITYSNRWPESPIRHLFDDAPSPSHSSGKGCSLNHGPAPTGSSYASGFDMTKSWAQLTPYKDADWGVPKGVPHGGKCELSQVHILHRHAQRYPTISPLDSPNVQSFIAKLNESSGATGPLEFLNTWEYVLGMDELMRTGASTEAASGANFWLQYGRLLYRATPENVVAWDPALNVYPNGTTRPKPVYRTTGQSRILESARWWLSGFFGDRGAHASYDQYDLVILPEEILFNNTLASYYSCPGSPGDQTAGDEAARVFISRYLKEARSRLAPYLPSDFNLTTLDVLAMQTICAYEYTSLAGSSFCGLFTEDEWKGFAYNLDLQYYGNYGFPSPVGRAQGIGYVLELAARLEQELITSSDTSVNYTYDNNIAQFPLGQPFYMDMSHDSIIISVMAALNLDYFKYPSSTGMPGNVDHPQNRTFEISNVTPFGARLITELWTCPDDVTFDSLDPVLYTNPNLESTENTTKYIRFMLNGAPLPMTGVLGCENATNGFCPLEKFLSGVPELKEKANYQDACYSYWRNHTYGGGGGLEIPVDAFTLR
ncbi:uncharacterized protein N7483_003302 [Penicillium malachiteum]|uniref:uncharacterized protein n=1 Tax=Penicillium malachiteum TaxID=1324776 RepID=UPI002546AB0A|nr:uncharacterized protein N7483_003302 [Penicillium malachiteum]KAJ5728794.1 hypothetical protein N7483_003302 [Penicillium malachiteum]